MLRDKKMRFHSHEMEKIDRLERLLLMNYSHQIISFQVINKTNKYWQ
jgi:hypothetical protein